MSNELERPRNGDGAIEFFGASQKITSELERNFVSRGEIAARLMLAVLTETPFRPIIDGQEYAIEVSNVFSPSGEEGVEGVSDTVLLAKTALHEFVEAEVPGAKTVRLGKYRTRYPKLLRQVAPSPGFTSARLQSVYDEAMIEAARAKGVDLKEPRHSEQIVALAPRKIVGLRSGSGISSELVTTDGHVLSLDHETELPFFSSEIRTVYFLADEVDRLSLRGGRAPRANIARTIEDRVVELRTKHSRR